ncbi:MAG: aminopeptidase P family protein [Saprospiraceae bacterium]|jgi:Xaa-Pro aminopeptidase|nr:aminopeptidase P family protein [Saprospiraceae bacterium]
MQNDIPGRLSALRAAMKRLGLDAYMAPSSDPHQSEYMADYWLARAWLSGFTGSAGILVVTADHAGLWTDSRYFLQAEQELANTGVELHKQVVAHAPEHLEWLCANLPAGSTVGFDGALFTANQVRQMAKTFYESQLEINHQHDLVSEIWKNRPALPADEAYEFDEAYAGKIRREKLDLITDQLALKGVDYLLVPTLDDIAWTLNLRGSDVAFNPVCISYLVVGREASHLFIQKEKVSDLLRTRLGVDGVLLKPYESIESFLQQLPEGKKIGIDPSVTSIRLFNAVPESALVMMDMPPRRFKAIKNEVEIGHLHTAMRKDGVALLRLFRWLEARLKAEAEVTEAGLAQQLIAFRSEQSDYVGESFAAIVGYNANGAIVHYHPDPDHSAVVHPEGILLLDSGGQYLQGTTDITRTIALSDPTPQQQLDFTLVLKGHINLAMAQFPEGANGIQIDTYARQPLWRYGLNYGHGTGHGVGFFLNVHEPPQGFAPSVGRGSTVIEPGMLTSNEPGLYRTGQYGIRTENLVVCERADTTEFGAFLRFRTISLFPIDRRLIAENILTKEEMIWLNEYHAEVWKALSPLLTAEEQHWLAEQTQPL